MRPSFTLKRFRSAEDIEKRAKARASAMSIVAELGPAAKGITVFDPSKGRKISAMDLCGIPGGIAGASVAEQLHLISMSSKRRLPDMC
mmetsp:Transcript_27504/g.55032  ORF Transcript_27504/g.55032 Transcript_27504/m.55032 type:complete len:88 (+) Transcript_27504:89-352(+)